MSGGKTGNVSGGAGLDFFFEIPQAMISALVTTGAKALVETKTTVELTRIIENEKRNYLRLQQQIQSETEKNKNIYEKNLFEQISSLKKAISRKGLTVPQVNGPAEEQLESLIRFLRSTSASSVASIPEVNVTLVRFEQTKRINKLYSQICETADFIMLTETEYAEKAKEIKTKAAQLLSGNCSDTEAFNRLNASLIQMLQPAKAAQVRRKSLQNEYNRELARLRAIFSILGITFFTAPFDEKTAERQILKFKTIAEEKLAYLEELRKNPAFMMSPDDRKKAAMAVSARICAVLSQKKHQLTACTPLEKLVVAYYSYDNAFLKVTVTETGGVSFEIVGDSKGKTEFTKKEKESVLSAMEHFQQEFPAINEELKKKKVEFNLWNSYNPTMSYVSFEEVEAGNQQATANQAAVLAMMNAAQQYMYADWSST